MEDVLKQLLEEIKVTNPIFPVQRFFTVLSKKRSEHEKILADRGMYWKEPWNCTTKQEVVIRVFDAVLTKHLIFNL